jgi:hypothetical protein
MNDILLTFLKSQLAVSEVRLKAYKRYLSGWGAMEAEEETICELKRQIALLENDDNDLL